MTTTLTNSAAVTTMSCLCLLGTQPPYDFILRGRRPFGSAGASELNEVALYESSGRTVVLDPGAARALAAQWLARRGITARAHVAADESSVVVLLRDEVVTTWLGLVGVTEIPVAAQAAAEPLRT
jgi:hypothetical protein